MGILLFKSGIVNLFDGTDKDGIENGSGIFLYYIMYYYTLFKFWNLSIQRESCLLLCQLYWNVCKFEQETTKAHHTSHTYASRPFRV